MKMLNKIMLIFLIVFIIIGFLCNTVWAEYDWSGKATDLMDATASGTAVSAANAVSSLTTGIINVARTVAVGVAIVMLIAVAMKYLMAAPGDRAEIKKHAVTYVVGAVVLFASSAILTIIANFAEAI